MWQGSAACVVSGRDRLRVHAVNRQRHRRRRDALPVLVRTSTVTERATPFGNKSRPIAAAHSATSCSAASMPGNSSPSSFGVKRTPSRTSKKKRGIGHQRITCERKAVGRRASMSGTMAARRKSACPWIMTGKGVPCSSIRVMSSRVSPAARSQCGRSAGSRR